MISILIETASSRDGTIIKTWGKIFDSYGIAFVFFDNRWKRRLLLKLRHKKVLGKVNFESYPWLIIGIIYALVFPLHSWQQPIMSWPFIMIGMQWKDDITWFRLKYLTNLVIIHW